jgi:hypothetical protein
MRAADIIYGRHGVFMKTSFKRLGAFDLEPDQYRRTGVGLT